MTITETKKPEAASNFTSNYDVDYSLKIYMRDINETLLLTREEEADLAKRIQNGDEKARVTMINANLRLVVKIAREYVNYGLSLPDLISEGNIGLIKAVDRFDPTKGGKLSTYGSWWIKQSIKRALANQGKTIRLPIHMVDKISKLRRITTLLTENYGREPTNEELHEETGIPLRKLVLLKRAAQRPTSLDAPLSEDGATSYSEIIGDEHAVDPFAALSGKNMMNQIEDLLNILDERESEIISARFGLNGADSMTLEEVGDKLGVTRERIRQLQNIALDKMRKNLRKKEKPNEAFLSRRAS